MNASILLTKTCSQLLAYLEIPILNENSCSEVHDNNTLRLGKSSPTGGIPSPASIFIRVLASNQSDYLSYYQFQLDTIEEYAKIRGYNFAVEDTEAKYLSRRVFRKCFLQDNAQVKLRITDIKGLLMREVMRGIYTEHGCKAKWVLFLDIDVVILDFRRRLEDIISLAHAKRFRSRSTTSKADTTNRMTPWMRQSPTPTLRRQASCHVIAQLAPGTINTGFLLFRMSSQSESIVTKWIQNQYTSRMHGLEWNTDQGMFQLTYLQHLAEGGYSITLDCMSLVENNNHKRNLCFAKNLKQAGIFPYSFNQMKDNSANSSKSLSSNQSFCLLDGLAEKERINIHDWSGVTEFGTLSNGDRLLVHHRIRLKNPNILDQGQLALTATNYEYDGTCQISNMFTYHGKVESVINTLRHDWRRIKNLYRPGDKYTLRDSNRSSVRRKNPKIFRGDSEAMKRSCYSEIREMYRQFAADNSWLPQMETVHTAEDVSSDVRYDDVYQLFKHHRQRGRHSSGKQNSSCDAHWTHLTNRKIVPGKCPSQNVQADKRSKIFIRVVVDSPEQVSKYRFHLSTQLHYSRLMGYDFAILHVDDILSSYKSCLTDEWKLPGSTSFNNKHISLLEIMRELFNLHGCNGYILLVNIDTVITDFRMRMEQLIKTVRQEQHHFISSSLPSTDCDVIAQLSPASVDLGLLLLRISPNSEDMLLQWLRNHRLNLIRGLEWQEDQGVFQQTLLQYLQEQRNITVPIDCLVDIGNDHQRNLCFAKNLHLLRITPTRTNFTIVKSSVNLQRNEINGFHVVHNPPLLGTGRYCFLQGFTPGSRMNINSWAGTPIVMQSNNGIDRFHYYHQIYLRNLKTSQFSRGNCSVDRLFTYRGSNLVFINHLQSQWEICFKSNATSDNCFLRFHSAVTSDGEITAKQDITIENCLREIQAMFQQSALENDWLPRHYRKFKSNYEEILSTGKSRYEYATTNDSTSVNRYLLEVRENLSAPHKLLESSPSQEILFIDYLQKSSLEITLRVVLVLLFFYWLLQFAFTRHIKVNMQF